jgi:arsenate reductase-like glutaredoxin family protein
MKEIGVEEENWDLIDLKNNPIYLSDLELIHSKTEMIYEELFNKRSRKYEKDMFSSEEEFKKGILVEYTFLKRPIIASGNQFFVGNSKKVVEEAKEFLNK